ncbi:hypothetical protein NQ317_006254 [Molorchus minor]|uniref:Uncharacterized protein n=1 Tax=Molorchus minor TaxID=1323400 RepID=A0ABQ9K8L7_9CUCU|nr:hypothetical protein NQ317_006254 [Molorchus minor]
MGYRPGAPTILGQVSSILRIRASPIKLIGDWRGVESHNHLGPSPSIKVTNGVLKKRDSIYKMYRVILIIVFVSLLGFCAAQVNFSPNWGKRALSPVEENDNNCRENVETVMLIYKIIQNEAQKLIDCEKFSNNQ